MSSQLAHAARRVPLIRFTHGINKTLHETINPLVKQVVEQAPKSQQKIANNSEFYQLPKKYLRKQLTNDEIEAINRGGL